MPWNSGRLRSKTLWVLSLALGGVGGIGLLVGGALLNNSLAGFERRAAEQQYARVAAVFRQDVVSRLRTLLDYAIWDEAVAHLQGRRPDFPERNFTLESMRIAHVHAVAFFQADGQLYSAIGMVDRELRRLGPADAMARAMQRALDDVRAAGLKGPVELKRWQDGGPVLMVGGPVRLAATRGQPQGYMVMFERLDTSYLGELAQATGAAMRLRPALPSSKDALQDSLGPSTLSLEVDAPEGLDAQRSTAFWVLLADSLGLVLLSVTVVLLMLDRLVLTRLGLFAKQASLLSSGAPAAWPVQGRDELDQLAMALNAMVDNLARAQARLEHEARTDTLTGLGNRRLLYEQLDALMAQQARQQDLTLALLVLDLDDFKLVNSSLGHEVGNALLVQTAQTLRQLVRAHDVVTRLGGDEFALVYVAHDRELGVQQFVRRVQEALAQPLAHEEGRITVTASVGIAYITPGADKDDLLRKADLAMYAAKGTGKGQHRYYFDAMLGDVQARMLLEQGLREALQADQLEVWFQPIVDVRSGEVAMFEALARWPREDGYCPPDRFIRVAEETGLINALGTAIVRKVLAALPALLALDARHVVNINLSPRQLMSRKLVEQMCSLMDDAGVARQSIHFELTESALAQDADFAKLQLDALAQAGFHLHLDDFGTGYSSLHRLQNLPFSTLKLDRSFVLQLGHGDERIARAIISLAGELGMEVIAEGIETAEQQARLVALGCYLIQGYWHARPMPLPQLLAWLDGERDARA